MIDPNICLIEHHYRIIFQKINASNAISGYKPILYIIGLSFELTQWVTLKDIIGEFVTNKFHTTGGVPVWNDQDVGWGRKSCCLDYLYDREICLVTRVSATSRGVIILHVISPRGQLGWVQLCNVKHIDDDSEG